jgi:hypothetical protein
MRVFLLVCLQIWDFAQVHLMHLQPQACMQVERAQRDKQDIQIQMSHLKKDLDHSQAKKRSMDASFDKLDKARERTRLALQHSRSLHGSVGGGASSSPGLQDIEPFKMSASRAPSRNASQRVEGVTKGGGGRNQLSLTGLESMVTEEEPRGRVLSGASFRPGSRPGAVDFSD